MAVPGRALLLLLAALAACALHAAAQQPMPFLGHGDYAPTSGGEAVDVHVSVFIDRMLRIDDREYEYEAVLWVYMSWRDARVKDQINATFQLMTAPNSTYQCQYPCQSTGKAIAGGCCDDVWQPYVAFTNTRWLPQDRIIRYAFGWNPDGDNVWYWRNVHGVFYASMDLKAYPFDRQALLLQMEVPQARMGWSGALVNLIPSVTGNAMFTARTGSDQLSGWSVDGVRLTKYSYPLCQMLSQQANMMSPPSDPSPLVPEYLYNLERAGKAGKCDAVISGLPNPRDSVFWRNTLVANVSGQPIMVSGLNAHILVSRFWAPYIITAIFPIVATTWLAFLVFFLPRKDMEARLGAVTGLFLALAAIQFVITGMTPASSYVTALQQLVLTSYVCLILVGLENVLLWWLTTYHAARERYRAHRQAQHVYNEKLSAVRSAVDAWLQQSREARGEPPAGHGATGTVGGAGAGAGGGRPPSARAPFGGGGAFAGLVAAARAADSAPAREQDQSRRADGGPALAAAAAAPAEAGADSAAGGAPKTSADLRLMVGQLTGGGGGSGEAPAAAAAAAARPRRASFGGALGAAAVAASDKSFKVAAAAAAAIDAAGGAAPPPARGRVTRQDSKFSHLPAWRRYPARWAHHWRVFRQQVREDPDYADAVAHKCNKWLALVQFLAYNASVVIIFWVASRYNATL